MRAFKEFGYRIPEDISIIGFDDTPICDFLEPPLTTMEVPKSASVNWQSYGFYRRLAERRR